MVTVRGTAVPRLGLGTLDLTRSIGVPAIREALDLGCRLFDTLSGSDAERDLGAAVAESGVPRDELFVMTRLRPADVPPVCVRPAVEASLRALGMAHLDVLLIGWPPAARLELEAVLDAMTALRTAGLVRHVGVSNFTPRLLLRALAAAPVFASQVEHHPYLGQPEMLAIAEEHDLLHVAYAPLASGFVLREPALDAIARARGADPAAVVLRWLLDHPRTAVVPRSRDVRHLAANLGALDVALSEADRRELAGLERGMRLYDPPHAPIWRG